LIAPHPSDRVDGRLGLGTAHRVQDAQLRQGHEIIELVGDAPEEAL
jgi:hypothetical protein